MSASLPRPVVAAIWSIGLPAVHAGIPWALSRIGEHHGWADGAPAWWNLLGLAPIAAAAAWLAWVVVLHVRHVPECAVVELSTSYLVERGPYAFSRNPMYLGELALWIGWTILFGSVAVAVGFVVLWSAMAMVVRWEERALAQRFGDGYAAYRDRTPRWLGRRGSRW